MKEKQVLALQKEARSLQRELEEQVSKVPGVVGTAVGLKEKKGKLTDEICLRVYVDRRRYKNLSALRKKLPESLGKFDVCIFPEMKFRNSADRIRPLQGGYQINNEKKAGFGTLGCIAVTRGVDVEYVVLSNWHVVYAGAATVGDKVAQPTYSCCGSHVIGSILTGSYGNLVDCAIASVKGKGVGVTNRVRDIGELAGSADPVLGSNVRKYGVATQLTNGVIEAIHQNGLINEDGMTFNDQIVIRSVPDHQPFSQGGDSGSVIVDNDQRVVGLLWGSGADAPFRSPANRIGNVLNEMQIDILNHAPTAAKQEQETDWDKVLADYSSKLDDIPLGKLYLSAVVDNFNEALELARHNRRVKVAFEKYKLRGFIESNQGAVMNPAESFTKKVGKVSMDSMLNNVGAALSDQGSPPMSAALAKYGQALMQYADCKNVNDGFKYAILSSAYLLAPEIIHNILAKVDPLSLPNFKYPPKKSGYTLSGQAAGVNLELSSMKLRGLSSMVVTARDKDRIGNTVSYFARTKKINIQGNAHAWRKTSHWYDPTGFDEKGKFHIDIASFESVVTLTCNTEENPPQISKVKIDLKLGGLDISFTGFSTIVGGILNLIAPHVVDPVARLVTPAITKEVEAYMLKTINTAMAKAWKDALKQPGLVDSPG